MKEKEEYKEEYCVQDTVDNWRQNPIYIGTLEECQEFCENNYTRFARAIMPLSECEVDYL